MKILLLNGPNLNMLGRREPEVYGSFSLFEVEDLVTRLASQLQVSVDCRQSNHEGELIDWIHRAADQCRAIIINPGAYTHTSIALRDALSAVGLPAIEVHISNVYCREEFRRHSLLAPVCLGQISGLGITGYGLALRALVEYIR